MSQSLTEVSLYDVIYLSFYCPTWQSLSYISWSLLLLNPYYAQVHLSKFGQTFAPELVGLGLRPQISTPAAYTSVTSCSQISKELLIKSDSARFRCFFWRSVVQITVCVGCRTNKQSVLFNQQLTPKLGTVNTWT
jgi:hypothetical protein